MWRLLDTVFTGSRAFFRGLGIAKVGSGLGYPALLWGFGGSEIVGNRLGATKILNGA